MKSRFVSLFRHISNSKSEAQQREALKNDIYGLARLLKVEKETEGKEDFPLKLTTLRTLKLLQKAYISETPATARDIQNAVFFDSAEEGYPIIKTFLNKGATFTQKDADLLKNLDPPAHEFLSQRLRSGKL